MRLTPRTRRNRSERTREVGEDLVQIKLRIMFEPGLFQKALPASYSLQEKEKQW